MEEMQVRIVGHNPPGLHCGEWRFVHAGIQCGTQVPTPLPGDTLTMTFAIAVEIARRGEHDHDFKGGCVHGRPGSRFLYLSWGEFPPGGEFTMFRRAKLPLSTIREGEIARALAAHLPMEAILDLTDRDGGPVCGSVPPTRIVWSCRE